jgi:hypothetical protein
MGRHDSKSMYWKMSKNRNFSHNRESMHGQICEFKSVNLQAHIELPHGSLIWTFVPMLHNHLQVGGVYFVWFLSVNHMWLWRHIIISVSKPLLWYLVIIIKMGLHVVIYKNHVCSYSGYNKHAKVVWRYRYTTCLQHKICMHHFSLHCSTQNQPRCHHHHCWQQ